MSDEKGNGEVEWISHELLRANGQAVVDVRGFRVRRVRAALPWGRGVRVRVLAPVHDDGGCAIGASGLSQVAVEFEGFIEGGLIVSELEVRR